MELQSFSGLWQTFQPAAVAILILAACYFLPQFNGRAQLARLPAFAQESSNEKRRKTYMQSATKLYSQGYEQFKDSVYRLTTSDDLDMIVIHPSLLPELRKLPDSVLSFSKAVENTLEVKYTKILTEEPSVPHTIKAHLTPALARLNLVISEEVDAAIKDELPPCDDWTAVPIYMSLAKMVAKISGRVFVGPELCRNAEYLDGAVNFTMDLMSAQRAVKRMRPWLRPILAPRLPEVRRLRVREANATAFIRPIVQARRDAEKNDPEWQKPDDMLQWLFDLGPQYALDTPKMAKLQLGLSFAAIHTTTVTTTNILYTLAVNPQYIQPLREEIRTVIASNGGVLSHSALQQMEKLDSFMKETLRYFPSAITSFSRKVLKGFTLSNGQYIPPGVCIEVPSHATYRDPAHYPDSDAFDGLRFYKLRQSGEAGAHARNQFVTSNEQDLGWGYGRHACPGRFFAANEVKMILVKLISHYDIQNKDGDMVRYPNLQMGRQLSPDPRRVLMFRKVQV
ncbi:cytochrome P450 monooxygenase-like protein [Massariosphaeria phaeospora]|uniref:Cytochrome P450 monooxygenase-like protein n=1 Tax=Massariosphaeria phaeospora TaxID=100035 RepID=A0A7C8ME42_9PLEO|nr:cytochrome P450 monooxygenase-like protein [Massariosphaeria phaeospora]